MVPFYEIFRPRRTERKNPQFLSSSPLSSGQVAGVVAQLSPFFLLLPCMAEKVALPFFSDLMRTTGPTGRTFFFGPPHVRSPGRE